MMSVFNFGAQTGFSANFSGTLVTQDPLVHFDQARSPSHGPEGEGNRFPFRRLSMLHGSRRYEVPMVSGNSIRGLWRRLLAGDLLARLQLPVVELGSRVIYLLTSGGGLEARDRPRRQRTGEEDQATPPPPEPVLRIGSKADLTASLPMVGLLGASYGKAMVEGSLRVGHAIPACVATAPLLGVDTAVALSDLTDWCFHTRRDDRLAEGGNLGNRAKQQQIIQYEYVCAGVTLHHSFGVEAASDLEVSCLAHALDLFRARPFLGGKWATGNGRVSVHYPAVGDPGPYVTWVDGHRSEIREYLLRMEPATRGKAG